MIELPNHPHLRQSVNAHVLLGFRLNFHLIFTLCSDGSGAAVCFRRVA